MGNTKYILVTGGAGYIGSHVCKSLSKSGYIPVSYDNLVYGHKDLVKWGPFELGDILDTDRLCKVFDKYKPCAVMHLAGFGYVGESISDPQKYYSNNIVGTLSLLRAMIEKNVKYIIFSSTCATFGIPDKLPILEGSVQAPINPYGQTKLVVEKILQDYDYSYGIKSVILRYFNAAGADPDGEAGEDHSPENHLIPLVLDAALGKRKNITLFGDDYPTSDGSCIRDYVHVTDIAEAHVKALNYLSKNNTSDIFNLGSEKGFSVKQIVHAVEEITQSTIQVIVANRRGGDPPVLIADAQKARDLLGWKPHFTDIDKIIAHAWHWHRSRFSLYKEETGQKQQINLM